MLKDNNAECGCTSGVREKGIRQIKRRVHVIQVVGDQSIRSMGSEVMEGSRRDEIVGGGRSSKGGSSDGIFTQFVPAVPKVRMGHQNEDSNVINVRFVILCGLFCFAQ